MLAAGSSVEFIDSLENIHIYTPGQRAPSLFVFTIDSLAYSLLSGTILTGFIHWWCQAGRGEHGSDAIETSSFQSPIWRRGSRETRVSSSALTGVHQRWRLTSHLCRALKRRNPSWISPSIGSGNSTNKGLLFEDTVQLCVFYSIPLPAMVT